ncbi:MAG: C-terminal target protein [Bacteroidetes bacterium]|nr:C-terminal target protein [Bacteroidota bacterium]
MDHHICLLCKAPKNISMTIFLWIICLMSFAQTTVTLSGEGTISCPAVSTATWSTPPAGVTFSNLTRGSGVTCTSAADGINGSGFNTANTGASFSANKYYTVTITADATHTFTLSSITWLTTLSSGSGQFTIQYKNNGGALTTFGTANQTSSSSNTFSGSVTVAAGTSIVIYAIPSNTGASTTTVRFKNNSTFTLTASTVVTCTTPNALSFTTLPTTTQEDAPMTVKVSAICTASGTVATGLSSGTVTLAAATGCGLAGTLTASFVNGVATFSNVYFTRSTQTATLVTTNAGTGFTLANVTSGSISVTAPTGGTATPTTIVSENFEGATQWSYTADTPTYTGSGGTANGNYLAVKSFSGPTNKAFSKSYTALNGSGEIESKCTATFSNQSISASYNYSTFSFQVGSPVVGGSGDGDDSGEDMFIETSTDGGVTWSTLLTYKGFSNFLLPLSSSSPVGLSIGGNATYLGSSGATQSAFYVTLPAGTTQFIFRMTATNNRSEENWVIDNISLIGTTLSGGISNPLPIATVAPVSTCPLTDATVSAVVSNFIGTLTYTWAPTTHFVAGYTATSATPVVNFATGAQTYTVTVKDGDGCTATASNAVTITTPSGNAVLAPATITLQEVSCPDANGWTYYADPADLSKWEFGIYKNGNNFTASVDITVKTAFPAAYDTHQDPSQQKATFTMGRYWNATVSTGNINPANPIKVRFFYSSTDSIAMSAAAQTFAATYGATIHAMEWFKTVTGVTYLPVNNTISDVPNKLPAASYTTIHGVMNGIPYREYAGLTGFSGGTAGIRVSPSGLALPVTLLYLTAASVSNSYIKLDWATASETGNAGFDIERSADGASFVRIGSMDGHGNSNSLIAYSRDDHDVLPNSIYYYRLKQLDYDGHYAYSNIVSAMITGEQGFVMEALKPNPASGAVTVNIITERGQVVDLYVTDVLGREVSRQQWSAGPGLNGTQLDISAWSKGVYYVTVRSAGAYYTKVLSVVR